MASDKGKIQNRILNEKRKIKFCFIVKFFFIIIITYTPIHSSIGKNNKIYRKMKILIKARHMDNF